MHLQRPGSTGWTGRARRAATALLAPPVILLAAAALTATHGPRPAAAQQTAGRQEVGQQAAGPPPVGRAPQAVTVRAVPARSVVRPGDRLPVAVVLEHGAGFHTWPHEPVLPPPLRDVVPVATDVRVVGKPGGLEVGEIQWPEPSPVTVRYTGRPVELLSYVDTAVAHVPLQLPAEQVPGPLTLELEIRFQACDPDVCYFPRTEEVAAPLEVVPAAAEVEVTPNEPALFSGYRMGGAADRRAGGEAVSGSRRTPTGVASAPELRFFGWSFSLDPGGSAGLVLLLLLAAAGGLLLNFTPCVLPLVPIKVMGLRSAADRRDRLLALATSTLLGIVAFWLALGGAIASLQGFGAISSLFQTGWFAPVVGGVVALAGLSLLGVFHLPVPRRLAALDPDGETPGGAFLLGLLIAVLSTPCTAPFMAGASAWAALQAPPVTVAAFGAIGAGMGLPYLALAVWPALLERLPRSGPGSVLVEQVMGILLLAVAAFFLGTGWPGRRAAPGEPAGQGYWWVVAALAVAAFLWLAVRTWQLSGSAWKRRAAGAAALIVAVLAFGTARSLTAGPPVDWVDYTPDRLERAREERRVVVMDFTAEWCLNCRALEAGVLHREPVAGLLSEPGVVPMRVDLTGDNPSGRAKLEDVGWVGLPLLAVYGPGLAAEEPIRYDSYTPGMVVRAVERARDGSARVRSPP